MADKTVSIDERTRGVGISELQPCPFCGHIPKIAADFPVKGLVAISCEYHKCKVHPYTVGMNLQETVQRWNRRAKPKNEVEIVRCWECSRKNDLELCPCCNADITGKVFKNWRVDDDGFCSCGERREMEDKYELQ